MDQSQGFKDSKIHKCNLCTETFSKEIYLQIHKRDVHDSARSGNILKRIVINIRQKEYKVDDEKSIEKEVEKTEVKKDKPVEKFVDKDAKSESVSIKVLKSDSSYKNDLDSTNKFINVKEIKIDPYEHIDEESILQQLNEKQQQLEKSDTDYGNTGYGVSSPGIQNERFLPKNQHNKRKLLDFENWCNGAQCPRADLNKRFLPRANTTTA